MFDINPALATNTALNTIDAGGPSSHVNALPPTQNSVNFNVSWSSQDDASGTPGSGIFIYNVYVSDDGGSYTLFQQTAAASTVFTGIPGHTYSFYSIAEDNVGHLKPAKTIADISTTVSPTATRIIAKGVAVTGTEGSPFASKLVASFTGPDLSGPGGPVTANIFWGDGTTSLGVVQLTGTSNGVSHVNVLGSHTYAEQGKYSVEVGISQNGATRQIVHSTANVADARISLAGATIGPRHGVTFGGSVATMIDLNGFNTLASDYQGTIDWGDHTTPSAATFTFVSPGHWLVKGMHTYKKAGRFTLKISAFDTAASAIATGIANVA